MYAETVAQFITDATRDVDRLVWRLRPNLEASTGPWYQRGEPASWIHSLPALARVLERAGRGDLSVILEYNPYQAGNARADAIICGETPDGRLAYLVIELKQWSQGQLDIPSGRVRGTGAPYEGPEGLRHPLDQARDYARFIRNFTEGFHDEASVLIHPVAFLHNARTDVASALWTVRAHNGGYVFAGDTLGVDDFVALVASTFDPRISGDDACAQLLNARYHQGPGLLDAAGAIFRDRDEYPLTPGQEHAFAQIQSAIETALSPGADRDDAVFAVRGGPGSGKTWLAMHLLGANALAHRQVSYATNSTSLREALRKMASRESFGNSQAKELVTSARTYWHEERRISPLDVLLVDEAHRTTEYTIRAGHQNSRDVRAYLEHNRITQLFELKKASKVLVLFIDEQQAITPKDAGTLASVKDIAARTGASFHEIHLDEQHRAGGSAAYEAWVDSLVNGRPAVWRDEDNFTVSVAETPEQLEAWTFGAAAESGGEIEDEARLLAGFCWPWQRWPEAPSSIDDVPMDITIGDWSRRWNLRKPIDGFPRDTLWAHEKKGREQVGSVFTAQGFEFDRCGVIIGPDMRWSPTSSTMLVDPAASQYRDLVRAVSADPQFADRIRNQYRVLLTRARKGVVVYSTDPATRELLRTVVNPEG